MAHHLNKETILAQWEQHTKSLIDFAGTLPPVAFFRQPPLKWSIAQNITHLTSSAKATRLAYVLPKFMLRWYVGKPNRPSRTYEELVAKYQSKLEQGGTASGRFVPKKEDAARGADPILQEFSASMNRLSTAFQKNWKEEELDQYIAPHPLLGKITLRELCYFTLYHIQHHQRIIEQRLLD